MTLFLLHLYTYFDMKQIKLISVLAGFYLILATLVWCIFATDLYSYREWLREPAVVWLIGIATVILTTLHYSNED